MPPTLLIRETSLPADSARLQHVIREYVAWLDLDLSYRGFDAEMADFDRIYTLPSGAFFLAESGAEAAGCAGLLRHDDEAAELKRVFVRPAFRGHDLGRRLVEAVIAKARALRFSRLILDAVPQTAHAQRLYERMGFEETAPYYGAVLPGTRFFAMTLR